MTTICIAEDRASEAIAIQLLVLTLTKHCSDAKIVITFPPANNNFKLYILVIN
jgi:hypothetical protein